MKPVIWLIISDSSTNILYMLEFHDFVRQFTQQNLTKFNTQDNNGIIHPILWAGIVIKINYITVKDFTNIFQIVSYFHKDIIPGKMG